MGVWGGGGGRDTEHGHMRCCTVCWEGRSELYKRVSELQGEVMCLNSAVVRMCRLSGLHSALVRPAAPAQILHDHRDFLSF